MPDALNILAFEPFYGGSHKAFIDGWIKNSKHNWQLLTLPGENWRWRNRNAAVTLSSKVEAVLQNGFEADIIFATSMINTSTLISLLPRQLRTLPVVTLFHENQLHYPLRTDNGRRHIDAVLNDYKSALASDVVWWNSYYNRNTLLQNLPDFFKKLRHFDEEELNRNIGKIINKSTTIPLGIDSPGVKYSDGQKPPHIVWAARWEHDKNPEELFRLLKSLKEKNINFRLSVIGEKTIGTPKCFNWAQKLFSDNIVNWGYLPSRQAYLDCLKNSDIIISTSKHEFFGLSIFEGAAAGCVPVLPNRLVYPELFCDYPQFICDGTIDGFEEHLTNLIGIYNTDLPRFNHLQQQAVKAAERFVWCNSAKHLDNLLLTVK